MQFGQRFEQGIIELVYEGVDKGLWKFKTTKGKENK